MSNATSNASKPTRKPFKLGDLRLATDEQLDALAEISESDKEAARALWRANAEPELVDLLDAQRVDESGKPIASA